MSEHAVKRKKKKENNIREDLGNKLIELGFEVGTFENKEASDRELNQLLFLHELHVEEKEIKCPVDLFLATLIIHLKNANNWTVNEEETKDIHHLVTSVLMPIHGTGGDDGFTDEVLKDLFSFILTREKDQPSKKHLFPDQQSLYLFLGLCLLFGTQVAKFSLANTKHDADPNKILGSLIYHCSKQFFKDNFEFRQANRYLDGIPPISAGFVKSIFKEFIELRTCDIRTFRQFLTDLIHFQHIQPFHYVYAHDILAKYSSFVYLNILGLLGEYGKGYRYCKIEGGPLWGKRKHVIGILIPVLLQDGWSWREFEEAFFKSKLDIRNFMTTLKSHFRKPSQKQEEVNIRTAGIEAIVKNAISNAKRSERGTIGNSILAVSHYLINQQLDEIMFNHKLKKDPNSSKTPKDTEIFRAEIQCVDDFKTEALRIAVHILDNLSESFRSFEILVALENDDISASTQKVEMKNNIRLLRFTDNTQYRGKIIRYGTVEQMEAYATKNLNNSKLGILAKKVETRSFEKSENLVAISPIFVIAWIHARIILEHPTSAPHGTAGSSIAQKSVAEITLEYVRTWLEDQFEDYTFDVDLYKKHIEAAVAFAMDDKQFSLDEQLKLERETVTLMKSVFKRGWIHLKNLGQKMDHSALSTTKAPYVYMHSVFSKPELLNPSRDDQEIENKKTAKEKEDEIKRKHRVLELTPIFTKSKTAWISAIEHEFTINKNKAIVILTTREHYKFLKDRLRCHLVPLSAFEKGKKVLLHTEMNKFEKTDSPIHFISCSLPRDMDERGLLLGTTICRDKIFTQRFILNEQTFSFDTKQLIKRDIPDDWLSSPSSNYSYEKSQIDDFLVKRNTRETEYWNVYTMANNKLNELLLDKGQLLGTTIEEKIDCFFKLLKLEKRKHHYASVDNLTRKLRASGKNKAETGYFASLLSDKLLNASVKHFANVVQFRDLIKPAVLNRKYRKHENIRGETVIHYKGDPNKHGKIEDREVMFKDSSAFQIEFDMNSKFKKISLIKGDFVFVRNPNSGLLTHFDYDHKLTKHHNEVTLFEEVNRATIVDEYIERNLKKTRDLQECYEHRQKTFENYSTGDIKTYPKSEIRIFKKQRKKNTFKVTIKNISDHHLAVDASVIGTKKSLFTFSLNKSQIGPKEKGKISGEYSGTDPINDENDECRLEIAWFEPKEGEELNPSDFEKGYHKEIPFVFH